MRFVFLAAAAFFMIVSMIARSPSGLDDFLSERENRPPPQAVTLPPRAEAEPEPVVEPITDPLANLAPESFAPDPRISQSGFGEGFGSGGPGLASASGSTETEQIVRERTSVDRPARVSYQAAPNYPPEARQKGQTGTVTLKVLVNPSGSIEQIRVQESEPPGVFDYAAQEAVRRWRFEPAFVKGQASASWVTQKIRFDMN